MNSDASQVFQFKISLKDIKPTIWRRIEVPAYYNFRQLHYTIQDSMGWKSGFRDYHLHAFRMKHPLTQIRIEIGIPNDHGLDLNETIPEETTKIAEYFKDLKTKAMYEYDFGDGWEHDVVLEKIFPAVAGCTYPRCTAGKRACPPEDCGGWDGYNNHVKIVKNSKHSDYKEHCEWVKSQDASLDPEEFDPASVKFYEGDISKKLSELVETLSIKFEPLTLVDQQLEPLFKPEQFDGEFEITEEYREKVLLWQFRAKKKINEYLKPRVTSPSLQTTSSQSQDEHFRNSDNIRIKVPKYHITRFYGDDASKWLTFWNSFETAVHNESLNKVDKFNYLKAHLGGSALNTVEGFPISAKAYDEAPLKNSNDLRSFRKFVDNCNVQLRSLNSLGVSSANYGKILCPMLLKLIPSDLLLDYNKLQQNGSGSDIQQLLSFLTQSLTAREQTYSTNKSSFELYDCRQETKSNFSRKHRSHKQQNQKSFHTACQLLTAPVKENKDKIKLSCIFCESMTHNSNECKYVINLSLEERKNILLRKGACFNCLKVAKHLSRNCPMNKTKCEICSGLHHNFFCFKQQKREIESLSTDLTNQNTGEVFLQTLTVYIKNGNSKQLVRAILDTGSQKSYISEYAAKFIGLKSIGKETITHGLFGGHKITEVHDKYLINLCSYDGKYSFNMEVNDQKNICLGISRINDSRVLQKLATLNVFISDSSANNKLCLFEKHSDEIHILLGSDIVGKLFTENSLLIHSLLTNREKISDLWDSLGIKDPSEKRSKLELQDLALKHCENTILRDDEGRYIVSIPWTEGSGKFEDHYSLAKGRLEKTVKTLKFTGRLFDYDQIPRRLSNLDFKDANLSLRFFRDATKSSYARHDFHLPFILSSNHPVIKALINYKHPLLGHDGFQMLMYKLRENFWILKRRKTIKEVFKICIICKRTNMKPISASERLLLQDRVRGTAIFEIKGKDLDRPLILKNRKIWILILICTVYRAIHLELLTSIWAESGTNFKGAYRLLQKVNLEKLKNLEKLNPISWKFIPPQAPWWGGFWDHNRRINWNLGTILKLYPSKDEKVRVAQVKTRLGSCLHPVQKLYLLEVMEKNKSSVHPTNSPLFSDANEGSHLPINIDHELSKHQGAATPLTQPCSSISNGGARLEPRAETSSHQQAETSAMQPCSSVSNGGGGLKLRAETSGHQRVETSSMQPCSSISDGEAGVEPRVETLELPDDLTSELQQPTPQRSRYGRLLKLRKRLNDSC
ncbi:uncharacterized protein y4hQ [Trichonephila clavata]|uniref:Uncharacterized protein y4hQ n=1 Tax=Trichonephila clavata TaxID=2740835 RepID=A0A8X6GTY1_TRICU|nr:uncharacterized protein y4hQ [Trichonephila clavata]